MKLATLPALAAAQRNQFSLFLIKAFEILHPGQPPLDAAWYLLAMCHMLDRIDKGEIKRGVITVPPRHLKSVTAAVAWPAFLLGHDPSKRIMIASYSEDLCRQHARQFRELMHSAWYKALFPGTRLDPTGDRLLDQRTRNGGYRKAVSVGGSITGHGADLIVMDDCMKADDARSEHQRNEIKQWYSGTLVSRLNDKATGKILSIQQRLHEDDLPALLLEQGYKHLNLPAIAERDEIIPTGCGTVHVRKPGDLLNPGRESQQVLDQLRRDLGPMTFRAQYQQDPVIPGGNMIYRHWFEAYGDPEDREVYEYVLQSWDCASSEEPGSSWSVCLTLGLLDKRWELIDVWRARVPMPALVRAGKRNAQKWSPDRILIECKASGIGLFQTLREDDFCARRVKAVVPRTDKETRLDSITPLLEAGLLMVPSEAAWLQDFQRELEAFPNGRYDDQVDALSQALDFIRSPRGKKNVGKQSSRRYPEPFARHSTTDFLNAALR